MTLAPVLSASGGGVDPPSSARSSSEAPLPSFPSLRRRNLRALYGADAGGGDGAPSPEVEIGSYSDLGDKSPKGSVDAKIRPLVDLINSHPEYVTLSSCSGRVALFDPSGGCDDGAEGGAEGGAESEDDGDGGYNGAGTKGTEVSGKGRGRWILVTHDVLPDLGSRIVEALRSVGRDRRRRRRCGRRRASDGPSADQSSERHAEPPIAFKHEPHPEYVTLSSCSGRVALFDPSGGRDGGAEGGAEGDDDDGDGDDRADDGEGVGDGPRAKGTKVSGKGRGRWILVTHDVLPDLGTRIVEALRSVGRRRRRRRRCGRRRADDERAGAGEGGGSSDPLAKPPPITFKHEPPLLHVGAASLAAGRMLLRIAKSECAMRESGLVVTDKRITVELRTHGTALCLPLMVEAGREAAGEDGSEDASTESVGIRLMPDEEYLRVLADEANDRLRRDERLLEKLLRTVREGLFSRATEREENSDRTTHRTRDANEGWATEAAAVVEDRNEETDDGEYRATLTPLPPLKLWKSAAAVLPRNASEGRACGRDDDLDLFAFGGQGIGPTDRLDADGRAPTCRRGDEAYRLSRRNGAWSDRWEEVVAVARTTWDGSNDAGGGASTLATSAGSYRVRSLDGIGGREGHAACALPSSANSGAARPHAMAVFGGRTGGPSAPTNDLFFFVPGAETGVARSREGSEEGGALGRFGRPTDVRGDFPEARFGHTMTALTRDVNSTSSEGEPLAVVAGGVGLSRSSDGEPSNVCLSSVHVLSRVSTEGFGVEDGLCHLRWDRLADLPSPRSYHAASFAGRSDRMYVFGGSAEVDDPFPSFDDADGHAEEGRSWFAVSLFGEGPGAHGKSDDAGDGCGTLPPGLVGCAAASLPLRPNGAVLCVGGVRGSAHPDSSDAARDPLSICSMPGEGDARGNLARARVKIDLAGAASENGSPGIDFGSCVHPCLASLPRREGVEVASVLLVGGGVPSFSFGQAYSRSYLIDVARVKSDAPSPRRRDGGDEPRSNNTKARPKVRSSIMANGKSTVQTDVVYVAAPNAKRAKGALESLGFLDKRYKMVKADYCLRLTDNDADRINGNHAANVAIPITKRCVEKLEGETTSDDLVSVTLRNLSLRFGTEEVPYSASSIAKMKQRRGLPG